MGFYQTEPSKTTKVTFITDPMDSGYFWSKLRVMRRTSRQELP